MGKKSDKKTVIILLVVLAISIIGSGIWTYNTLKPTTVFEEAIDLPDVHIEEVFSMKEKAIKNVKDFLDVDFAKGTIWEDFYSSAQFSKLQDMEIIIDTENNIGNPNPFIAPTSTDDGRGEE
jgi:hypothetical protein